MYVKYDSTAFLGFLHIPEITEINSDINMKIIMIMIKKATRENNYEIRLHALGRMISSHVSNAHVFCAAKAKV